MEKLPFLKFGRTCLRILSKETNNAKLQAKTFIATKLIASTVVDRSFTVLFKQPLVVEHYFETEIK